MNYMRYTFVAVVSAVLGYIFAVNNDPVLNHSFPEEEYPSQVMSVDSPYTSYDIFEDINTHRGKYNRRPLSISDRACNSIATRWQDVTNNFSHAGFDSFVQSQINSGRWDFNRNYSELLVETTSRSDVIKLLSESMSHNELLLRDDAEGACVYTDGTTSVIFIESY